MKLGGFVWIAILACGAAVAYGVYAPETADRWLPAAGGLTHGLHDRIWTPAEQTASAPGQSQQPHANGPAPLVVTVTPVKRADCPVVLQRTASIAADAAESDAARTQLDYTTIKARISGRVGFRLIDEGNLVSAGQQTGIVSIAQLQPITVVFAEPQEFVPRINQELAAGAPPVTVMDAEGHKLASGR